LSDLKKNDVMLVKTDIGNATGESRKMQLDALPEDFIVSSGSNPGKTERGPGRAKASGCCWGRGTVNGGQACSTLALRPSNPGLNPGANKRVSHTPGKASPPSDASTVAATVPSEGGYHLRPVNSANVVTYSETKEHFVANSPLGGVLFYVEPVLEEPGNVEISARIGAETLPLEFSLEKPHSIKVARGRSASTSKVKLIQRKGGDGPSYAIEINPAGSKPHRWQFNPKTPDGRVGLTSQDKISTWETFTFHKPAKEVKPQEMHLPSDVEEVVTDNEMKAGGDPAPAKKDMSNKRPASSAMAEVGTSTTKSEGDPSPDYKPPVKKAKAAVDQPAAEAPIQVSYDTERHLAAWHSLLHRQKEPVVPEPGYMLLYNGEVPAWIGELPNGLGPMVVD